MKRTTAEKKIEKALHLLEKAGILLFEVEDACREAGMDDDQGNIRGALEEIHDVINEVECEGLHHLK